MRKINKNIFIFVYFIVVVVFGVTGNCYHRLKAKTKEMLIGLKNGNLHSVIDYRTNVDSISNTELRYHAAMMDLNSLKENILGTRILVKDGGITVKADSGSLVHQEERISDNDLNKTAGIILKLQTISEQHGAHFLYCIAPNKELLDDLPPNATNCSKENYTSFIDALENAGVKHLDLFKTLGMDAKSKEYPFYFTDHHWTTKVGLQAVASICNTLPNRFGFEYNKDYVDLKNYNTKQYKDWFLGSFGKTVGAYFTSQGFDDFELITPKFKTDMIEEQPIKEQVRKGSFEETVLYMGNMKKDYYHVNTYATYSGGDFRLQIITNNYNPNGKKMLLIRDSYACVVAPFLSLQTSQLHVCDMRDMGLIGEKLNIEEYIKKIHPDYVLVLYSGVKPSYDSIWDFF